jgi:hypothetical protein
LRRERPEDRLNWVLLRLRLVVRAFCLSRASSKVLSAPHLNRIAGEIALKSPKPNAEAYFDAHSRSLVKQQAK